MDQQQTQGFALISEMVQEFVWATSYFEEMVWERPLVQGLVSLT